MPLRGEGSSVDLVKEGRVAQAVYWMHAAAWWRELSFDWDVAPTPAGPARRATYGAVNLLGIGRQTKGPDAAWAFAGVALSSEADLEIASGFGSVVLRQSGIPAWRERMKAQRPSNLDLIEETAKGLSLEPLSKPHPQLGQVEAILQARDGRPAAGFQAPGGGHPDHRDKRQRAARREVSRWASTRPPTPRGIVRE